MKHIFKGQSFIAVLFLLGLFFFAGLTGANAQNNQTIYGVTTGNQLVQFNAATPGTLTTVGAITGLQTSENILGIDFRPATGQLFGLGSSSRIYIINITTGAATAVGGQFSTLLSGTNFGFDFNPTVDRIRIVSDTGQNLRINPNNGAVTVDGNLNPGTPAISAVAYTNSFGVSTTTTLYDIDTTTDRLLIQSNPNVGTLTDVGPLGVDFQNVNGFDIASNNVGGAATTTNIAYAVSASTLGNPQLYTINLTTGAATAVGSIGGATNLTPLRGISAATSAASASANLLDTDGNRRADYLVSRVVNGNVNAIYGLRPDGSASATLYGFADDIFTPGDYDGDGRTDLAVWRPSNGTFYVLRSSDGTVSGFQFGLNGDEPVARDYDGDGRTDYAVVRRSNGVMNWYIQNSAGNTFRAVQFGSASDVVAPGDYDGDRRFDLAVFRGSGNQPAAFLVQRSTGGFSSTQFGVGSDTVVPGDYDGDGRTDYAVVRTGTAYRWFILRSSNNTPFSVTLGTKPHLTVQNDYDGDGRTDVAVWNPLNGFFYVVQSSNGVTTQTGFGQNGDYPIANYDTH